MTDKNDGEQWEDAGRALFNRIHAEVRDDLTNALDRISWKIDQGHPITSANVESLRRSLEDAEFLAQQAATICPETEPYPDWTEVLDDEAVKEYARRVQEDEKEGEDG